MAIGLKISSAQAGRYALGGLGIVTFLLGLYVAASAADELATAGFFMTIASLALVFWQIKRAFDAYDADPNRPRKAVYATPVELSPSAPPRLEEDPLKGKPKHVFEGGWARPARERPSLLDEDSAMLVKGIVFAAGALFALFVAARGDGWSYYLGLTAAFVFVALIFRMVAGPQKVLRPPQGMLRWIVGGLVGTAALAALMIASSSAGGAGYYMSLIFVAAALGYLFYLIKVSFDEAEARRG